MRKHGFGWNLALVASVAAVGGLAFTVASFATPNKKDTTKSTTDAVRENAVANVATDAGQVVFEGGATGKVAEGVVHVAAEHAFSRPEHVDVDVNVAGVGTCPNAGGYPGSGQITQNVAPGVDEGGTVACGAGGNTTEQGWARCYNLLTEGVPAATNLTINSVQWFHGTLGGSTPVGGVKMNVNIYTIPGVCPVAGTAIPFATADLRASQTLTATAIGTVTVTFTPGVVIPAGSDYIVEVEQLEDGVDAVPPYEYRPSDNDDGECDSNYIRANDCGLSDWASMATIGFPTAHLIQVLGAVNGGTAAVCGNTIVENGEDCDPPGLTCSNQCQSAGPGHGACCNGITCTIQQSTTCTGTYLGDGVDCTGAPCAVGACCTVSAGQPVCAENVPLATCTGLGGTLLPATDCSPNCCPAPATGTDSCETQVPAVVAVPGSRIYSGDNSSATLGDSCGAELDGLCITATGNLLLNAGALVGCEVDADCQALDPTATCSLDRGWFESFTINSCANVTIDFCCTTADIAVAYGVLYPACPCASGILRDTAAFGPTGPGGCTDGNFSAQWLDLQPGTYRLPIFSAPIPANAGSGLGPYQIHITTTACALGRCCNGGVCTANVDQSACIAGGGFWGGPNSICFPPGVCGSGACCVDEVCTNGVSAALCTSQGGDLFPGQTCNICTGGTNDGVGCTSDANCTGGGTCTAQNVFCPPINDDCADAEVVVNGTFAVDNLGATTDGPADGCGDGGQVHNDVWFSYTATCTGDMTLEACGNEPFGTDDTTTDATNFDTVIAVYQGAACPPAAAPLGCDDDGCLLTGVAGGGSVVTVSVTSGTTYLIRIGGFAAANEGQALVTLSVLPAGGACCNTSAGTCQDVAGVGNCISPNQYHDGVCCKDVVCNVQNTCDWDNGVGDPFGAAPSSQYAPGEFYSESADNFILKGSPSNPCEIDGIKFWVTHFNQAVAGCTDGLCRCTNGDILVNNAPVCADASVCVAITEGKCSNDCSFCFTEDAGACGGVPANCIAAACTNSPADYCGVNVTIYQDAFQTAGTTKDQTFDVVPDLAIPDCDGLLDPFTPDIRVVVGDPGTFLDLDVDIQMTHGFVGDLVIELSHFDGATTVTQRLLQRVGDGGGNDGADPLPLCTGASAGGFGSGTADLNVRLDDEANVSVEDGPFPLAGSYRPNPGLLSAFNGRTKNGTWTLRVHDAAAPDAGTLNSWALHFTNSGNEAIPKGPSGDPNDDGTHSGVCVGGANDGLPCTTDANCPGGKCGLEVILANVPVSAFLPFGTDGDSYEVTLDLTSLNINLDKNKKYWLALSPVVPFTGFYQTGWITSMKFDGNPAQQIFDLVGLTDWTEIGDEDLAFQILGTKPVTGCSCSTVVDCRNSLCAQDNACNCATCSGGICVFTCTTYGNTNCSGGVTLDDILCCLAGFANFASCPNGDISPCGGNGILNLDDILAVLNAFGGGNPCGCLPGGTPDLCGSVSP